MLRELVVRKEEHVVLRSVLFLGFLLVLAGGLWAQEEDRPVLAPPEPKREPSAAKPFILSRLVYGQGQTAVGSLPELVKYFRKATTLQTPVECNAVSLGDPRLAGTSLLYITSSGSSLAQLGEYERKKLGEFLQRGGLLFGEETGGAVLDAAGMPVEQALKALVKDPMVLGPQGAGWRDVPNQHPLNSSYFDFAGGPPLSGAGGGDPTALQMLEVRGRVVAIWSRLGLSRIWGDPEAGSREACLRYGVNLIVFGMTQRAAGAPPKGRPP